jgi:protein-tyrosine phosphatase
VMDRDNLREVRRLPGAASADVRLLRSFDPDAPPDAEVPDPYAGGAAGFEHVLDQCERACAGVIAWIRARESEAARGRTRGGEG